MSSLENLLPTAPAHWRAEPLWTMFTRVARKGFPDETLLSVYRDHGVVPKSSRSDNFNRASDDLGTYQLVNPGDLVVNKMKTWQGSLSISSHRGIVSPAYFVYHAHHRHDPRYLQYLLRSRPLIAAYGAISTGVRINQWDLDPQEFSRLKLPMPARDEQRAIADYLDRETAQIDALVAKQEQVIAKLRERRTAVVATLPVTSIHPDIPVQDSGYSWLPAVPSHWQIRPLWSMFSRVKDTGHPGEQMLSVFRERGVVVKDDYENINQTAENRSIYQLIHPGWLATNRMKAWQGSVGISAYRGIVSGHYLCFAPTHSDSSEYLNWLFRSPAYATGYSQISRGVRIGQAEIDNDDYRVLPVLVPPIEEQREIAARLATKTSAIDVLVAKSEKFITLATERRAALVASAVAGQPTKMH